MDTARRKWSWPLVDSSFRIAEVLHTSEKRQSGGGDFQRRAFRWLSTLLRDDVEQAVLANAMSGEYLSIPEIIHMYAETPLQDLLNFD